MCLIHVRTSRIHCMHICSCKKQAFRLARPASSGTHCSSKLSLPALLAWISSMARLSRASVSCSTSLVMPICSHRRRFMSALRFSDVAHRWLTLGGARTFFVTPRRVLMVTNARLRWKQVGRRVYVNRNGRIEHWWVAGQICTQTGSISA